MKKVSPAKTKKDDVDAFIVDRTLYKRGARRSDGHAAIECRIALVFPEMQMITVKEGGIAELVETKTSSGHKNCDCLKIPGSPGHYKVLSRRIVKRVAHYGTYNTRYVAAYEYYLREFKRTNRGT
jgi:hypothetical protein